MTASCLQLLTLADQIVAITIIVKQPVAIKSTFARNVRAGRERFQQTDLCVHVETIKLPKLMTRHSRQMQGTRLPYPI